MLVTMSNPGLQLAIVGNPGRRRKTRGRKKNPVLYYNPDVGGAITGQKRKSTTTARKRTTRKGRKMPMTKAKRRAIGRKVARELPRTEKGRFMKRRSYTKSRRRSPSRRQASYRIKRRRAAAQRIRRKLGTHARGYHVIARRKAGRRKANRKFHKFGIRTGRRGTVSIRSRGRNRKGQFKRGSRLVATNPRHRRRARRNPMTVASWRSGLTTAPKQVMDIFSGKNILTKTLMATGGAVVSTMAGATLGNLLIDQVVKMLPDKARVSIEQGWIRGGVGAAVSYTAAWGIGTALIKSEANRTAFITGGAIGAVLNLLMPGKIAKMLVEIPGMDSLPGMKKAAGLEGYVRAPGYQGVGAYVRAPSYQGVGMLPDMLAGDAAVAGLGYNDDALAGELGAYVRAPSYQGVGDLGMYGCSHLDG